MKLKQFIFALVAMLLSFVSPAFAQNVAKVGNTEYATIDEAIANWTNNATLTLLADVTLSDVVKINSNESRTLDLGTYTMTAASGKDAFQYEVKGCTSDVGLSIKADATNPGGIKAPGKAIITHYKPLLSAPEKDRPYTQFFGGVFEAEHIIKQAGVRGYGSGYTGSKAPRFVFWGGVFNGKISTNRSLVKIVGGTFNGEFWTSFDSSSWGNIQGGKFKHLSNLMGSNLDEKIAQGVNNYKFTIGSAKATYDRGIYVDKDGYYVITSAPIKEVSAKYPAVYKNTYGGDDYFYYSAAQEYGMFYEDASMAIEKHGEANVTVYEHAEVVEELDNNAAVKDFTPELPSEVVTFEVEAIDVEATTEATTKVTFNVEPKNASGQKVSNPSDEITFRLPVPAAWTGKANVYHEGTLLGAYTIKEESGAKYVEVSSANFSEFAVEAIVPLFAGEGTEASPYIIDSADKLAALRNEVNGGEAYAGVFFKLTSDITLSGEWTAIGNGSRSSKSYTGNAFKGVFDGDNNTISGLTITSTTAADAAIGLFGVVDGGTVKNLNLTNVDINVPSSNLAGAAIGMMLNKATADNITVSGAVVGNDGVGGIVGRVIIDGTIENCINNASVTSSYGGIGGIVGKAYYEDGANTATFATVTGCTNKGTITAPMYVGGIAGLARAKVTNCVNEGAVVGGTQTGGIVGQLMAAGTVSGNENKAKVSGKSHVGGIIGDYSQSSSYTYNNVTIANNVNRGELAATEQCAAILGCNNIDGFTAMTATGNQSFYYVEGLELFGNPEDMVMDATNKFILPTVAIVNGQEFSSFTEALEATKTMTGDVTVEIYDKVTFNQPLIGNYTSINFVGKDTDAEMYLDVQGYTTATGKKVSFTDLKLSKSEGGFIANAGFMNVAFGIYDVKKVSYNNCTFLNGACASSGEVTFNGCTFYRSHDRYGLWAYGAPSVTVDGCTFADIRGIKLWDEGKQKLGALTVKNTDFSAVTDKPAIVLTSGKSVVLAGNTYNADKGTFELDLDGNPNGTPVTSDVAPVCVNDNGACGVLVDGKIYTTVAQAAEVATSGSTVTLLHNSAETVALPMGVTLNKNNFEAAGVTVAVPVAKIGDVEYATLAAAVEAAQAGAEIVVVANVADVTVDVTKNLTISGDATLNNVGINANGADALTVKGLTFTGNSWINSGTAEALTVSGITATVAPNNTSYTNSRSAFISLGRSEGQELALTVENSNITVTAAGADAILGWAKITAATITGNVIKGSNDGYFTNADAIKFMSIANGAEFEIKNNEIWSNYNGIVFGQNTTRANAYSVYADANKFVGGADHIWIEVSGANTVHATVNATSANTVNGNAFTINDIKYHSGVIKNWTSYAGVDVVTDANGKVIGGTLASFSNAESVAEGYEIGTNGVVGKASVAEVNGVKYASFAEAAAAAQTGNEIKLLANIEGDITVPADVTLNGNGFAISGGITAAGEITFAGVTKAASFNVENTNTVVNIPAGASLQLTGTGRMVIGHGCTFNITGTIEDAKTADKATLVPSLKIAAGASITGNGVTFNVNNAYIVANANTTSKNSNANGTLDFNINNSIWEQTGVLAFYVPTSGKDPVVNFELKNSVLTTTSHLVFSVTKGEIVIDNSLVNQGASRQIENRSTMTIKNGSVVNGAVATSSNAINPGTIIVENATYAVTGEFSGAAEGTGTLVIKKGANVSVGSIKAGANVTVDAEGMAAGDEINFTANLSQFTGTLSVINNDKLEASIVNGKVVLAAKPVAKIGEQGYATLGEAVAALKSNETLVITSDITPGANEFIELNGKTNVTLAAAEGVVIKGNIQVGHHPSHTDNDVDRSESTFTVNGLTVEGTLTVCSNDAALVVKNTKAAQITVKTNREGMDIDLNNNTADGDLGTATNSYGMFLVPNATGYDLKVDRNTFKNINSHAFVVQGCGDGSAVTAANSIVVTNNKFESWGTGGKDNRAAFKIWADTKYAPAESDLAGTTNAMRELVDAIAAGGNTYSSTADNTVEFDAYGAAGDAEDFPAPMYAVAKIGAEYYTSLADAFAAGGEVKVLQNIVLAETAIVPAGKVVTLDLNGKTISQTKECTASYEMICNKGNLTITGNGKISFTDTSAGDPNFGWGSYTVRNEGNLVVENGTIEHLGTQTFGTHCIMALYQYAGSTTINGGTISTPNYRSVRLWKGDMTINDGTFEGQLWVQAVDNSANLTINGGTFAPRGGDGSSVFVSNSSNDVEFNVTGGTFTTKIGCSDATKLAGAITGGKFTEAAKNGTNSALIAEHYLFGEADANGYYGVIADPGYIAELTIVDGSYTEFVNDTEKTVGKLTYQREFVNIKTWQAFYVPFEIELTPDFLDKYDVAYFNDIRCQDEDFDGQPDDDMVMEAFMLKKGKLRANYPYLIRPKTEEALSMNRELYDVVLSKTTETTVTCTSVFMRFELTGVYASKTIVNGDGQYAFTKDGVWKYANTTATIKPFRLILKITSVDGKPYVVSETANIRIRIDGEGDATDIEGVEFGGDDSELKYFDLMGRPVVTPVKGRIYIVNGKKVLY